MIYLIRHPETVWNIEGRFQGIKESSLTSQGIKASKSFIKQIDIKPDVIMYANNSRTQYLAELLHEKYPTADIQMREQLNERSFGDYEGEKQQDMGDKTGFDPQNYLQRYEWKPPQGESYKELVNRTASFIKRVNEQYQNKNVFCITSGGVIRSAIKIHRDLTMKEMFKMKPANLEIFTLD